MLNYAETDVLEEQAGQQLQEEEIIQKYLVFNIGQEKYGISIEHAKQIIQLQDVTPIPYLPDYMSGITNLRGAVIPVMDVRVRFNVAEIVNDEETCIIIVDYKDMVIGLTVDGVQEVKRVKINQIVMPPKSRQEAHKYISGFYQTDDSIILLIDCNLLFQY